jgi:hypothetical protein
MTDSGSRDTQRCVGGRTTKEELEWGNGATGLTWSPVDEVSCGGEGFDPEFLGHGGVKKEAANAVVDGANDALCLAILR